MDGMLVWPWRRRRAPALKGTQDFLGVNYYTEELVRFRALAAASLFGERDFPPGAELSATKFIANAPGGIFDALSWGRRFGVPMLVTENGVDDPADSLRPRYLAQHLREVWRAINFNWPIKGYFHWTLVDNFEWDRGWTQRFGLWELDVPTQGRIKRASADFYAQICKSNSLSSEAIERFAPQIYEEMFPD